jgi:hypothetical protein
LTPDDELLRRSDREDLEQSRRAATPTPGIAVSPMTTGLDAPSTGDLADEIAHLQALIEGLAQKVEWRIPDVPGR